MKTGKWFRVLGMAVVLCLVMVPLTSLPALAAYDYDIELQDSDGDEIDSGEIGDYVYVVGDDWPPSDYTEGDEDYSYVDIYFTSQDASTSDDIDSDIDIYYLKDDVEVDDDGDFEQKIKIPTALEDGDDEEDVHGGTYYFCVTLRNSDDIKAVAEFTVKAAEITLDPDNGPVGTAVEITGADFEPDDDLTVDFDGVDVDIEDGDDTVDDDGEFTLTVLVPEDTAGDHTITVTDESDNSAEATFDVEPGITLSATTGAAGDTITVNGTGFGKDVDVSVEFDGTELNADITDDYGSFAVGIKLPVKAAGSYTIEAKDDEKNKATETFTMAAGITLNPTSGNVDTQVTVSGSGFTPNASVNVTYAGTAMTSATADTTGKFSASFNAPKGQSGAQTVQATDGANTATATFTMEEIPPPVPAPQLPLADDKAKAQASFDWDEVTDPSGVTYSLQIATDTSFSASSIVFQETGIVDTGYTLPKGEKLVSTKKDAPYYWRIQAVDGAGNESGWTTPGAFYVGFSLSFPTWALYTIIGIAGVLLLAVGYLLGRRTSYL